MSKKNKITKDFLIGKSNDELLKELESHKKELFNLRFQAVLGDLQNTIKPRMVRKDIARINTELAARKNKQNKGQ